MFPIYPNMQMLPLQPFVYPVPQIQMQMQRPFPPAPLPAQLPPLLPPQQPFQQQLPPLPQPQLQPLRQPHAALGQRTLYILSYSTEVLKHHPNAQAQLLQHTPTGIPTLLTIYCYTWRAPPPEMCEMYSGVSPQIQQFVIGSRTAAGDINKAVTSLATYFNAGHQTASIHTTCHAGTHRSVAAAEIVASEMRKRDVSVVVRHLHRRRGLRDAW